MKLEINYEKKTGKLTNMQRLNNMLLNNQRISEEIKRFLETYEKEIQRTIRHYYQQLHANNLDNPEEIAKFLEIHNLPNLNHVEK